MSKRAILLDKDNELIAHPSFAEVDDYIARGLVERLTPVKARTHVFRLIDRKAQAAAAGTVDFREYDPSSLSASIIRANAGAASLPQERRAKRRVRIWPHVGDTKAPRVGIRVEEKKKQAATRSAGWRGVGSVAAGVL